MFLKTLKMAGLACLMVLVGALGTQAEDVILKPGKLTGHIDFGSNYQVRSFNINAYGGGYSSSQHLENTSDYSLTVQGGPWDYRVVTSASFNGGNGWPYVSFSDRYLQVNSGSTVTNDYAYNPGIVRFEVTISGDDYSYWNAHSWATKAESAGQEKTYSSMGTIQFHANGAWEMPVVSNQQIKISSRVYIDGPGYNDLKTLNFDFGLKDIAPGEVVTIPIHIDYVAPPPQTPPVYTPPAPRPIYYGFLEGTVWLQNLPAENLIYHMLLDFRNGDPRRGFSRDNPGTYSARYLSYDPNATILADMRPATYYKPYPSATLWPYKDGDPQNNKFQVTVGETHTQDFILEAGILTGNFSLLGPVSMEGMTMGRLSLKGSSPTSNGGIAYSMIESTAGGYTYKAYLSEGEWRIYGLSAQKRVSTPTPYFSSLGASYGNEAEAKKDFGFEAWPHIDRGGTTVQDMEYCVGDVIYRFRDASGGVLSVPRVWGNGTRVSGGKTIMSASVSSYSSASQAEAPQVEIFGPPGVYQLQSSVTAGDGSYIRYPLMTKTLYCGVQEIIDIPGPTLRVNSPVSGLITNATSLPVSGTVASNSTVIRVLVDAQDASLTPSSSPNEVNFNASLPLAEGTNIFTTTAFDASGARASDTRIVLVDRWMPELGLKGPADGALFWYQEGAIPVEITAGDRGYGHTLTLYLDGEAIYQVEAQGDEASHVTKSYSRTIGPLAVGDHILTAEVTDRAGNTVSTSVAITSFLDNWPPTVDIVNPYADRIFAGSDSVIPLEVQATDRGSGYVLEVSLDGAEAYRVTGPPDREKPASVWLNQSVGPLSSGVHSVEAVATDTAGNSASTNRTFRVDGWQPQVSILTPGLGSLFAGTDESIPLAVTASDQGFGYDLRIYLDEALVFQTDGPADDATAAEIGMNDLLGPLSSGAHAIRAVATDASGNQAVAETSIYVDGWLPEVDILGPKEGGFFSASDGEIPLQLKASDQGYGYTLEVYLDGSLLSQRNGAGNATTPVAIGYDAEIGPLAPGNHEIVAIATDKVGNRTSRTATFVSYLPADVTVKPEARNNDEHGAINVIVRLPEGVGSTASLLPADHREITASNVQQPYDVHRSGVDKLILKFKRTPELMADKFFTIQGKYFPEPSNPGEFYYWRGSDTTKW